jgi:8-oxo-dGTP pyrophosphatase MutT (NUDIX family)
MAKGFPYGFARPAREGAEPSSVKILLRWLLVQALRVYLGVLKLLGKVPRSAAVACWQGDRILLVRNSYRRSLGFPGGLLRRGESFLDGAVRELREEVALCCDPEQLSLALQFEQCLYFETELSAEARPRCDDFEVSWAGFVPWQEALQQHLTERVRTYLEQRGPLRATPCHSPISAESTRSQE